MIKIIMLRIYSTAIIDAINMYVIIYLMIMLIMLHIDLNHSSNDYRVLLRDLQA